MEENKAQKISFFKKVWYSITKFEKYPDMAAEGLNNAIKYLFIMTTIVTIFITIGSLIKLNQLVGNLASYIEDNIPEFSYSEGKITMQLEEPMVIENVEYDSIDRVVINPLAENDEEKAKSKEENNINGITIFFFKDQVVLKNKSESGEEQEEPYTYNDFIASYTRENISSFDKQELIEYMTSEKMNSYYMRYALSLIVYLIIMNMLVALLDTLELAVLGWITAITARIKMRFLAIYNMAIYALTLPIILNMIYVVINYFTEFTISYFQVAYISIAYIYLAASIFIIKDDFMKKQEEVEKIKQEQIKVKEEIRQQEEDKEKNKEEKKNKKKEKKPEDEKNNNDGEEPKGSEA